MDVHERVMINQNYFAEKRLLKQCAANDSAAQARFASASYRNQVYRTASEVNRSWNLALGTEELGELCQVLIARIYAEHATLPNWKHNLYRRIEDYIFAAVMLYLREATR